MIDPLVVALVLGAALGPALHVAVAIRVIRWGTRAGATRAARRYAWRVLVLAILASMAPLALAVHAQSWLLALASGLAGWFNTFHALEAGDLWRRERGNMPAARLFCLSVVSLGAMFGLGVVAL